MPRVIVGIDDTDSETRGCTTYVMYSIIKEVLRRYGEDSVVGLPRLTRLNPYVPFKTRGNASLSVMLDVEDVEDVVELAWSLINDMRNPGKASPGLAYKVLDGHGEEYLAWLYKKALRDLVPMNVALRVAEKAGAKVKGGRGVVGALASLGFSGEFTFEFIAYRGSGDIDLAMIKNWDEATIPFTFLNVWRNRLMLKPRVSDPVFVGVRGDSPYHVLALGNYLASIGRSEGWILYMTNQGTEAHRVLLREPRPYSSVGIVGVIQDVVVDELGHCVVKLDSGVKVMVYRHLGIKGLGNYVGCLVYVWGGARPYGDELIVYAEGLRVLHDRVIMYQNPRCPLCGGSMESLGRSGGFRCRKCGFRGPLRRITRPRARWGSLRPRLSEYRHLAKPPSRLGIEGISSMLPRPYVWIR